MTTSDAGAVWQATSEQGLYKHRDSGRYYSRLRVNGKRTFRALQTDVWSRAVAKHRHWKAEIADQQAQGVTSGHEQNLRTLGDCCAKLLEHLKLTGQADQTKINYRGQIEKLYQYWPRGTFHSFNPAHVDFDVLLELRDRLQRARWSAPAGFKGIGAERKGVGYSNRYINQILSRLRNVLDVARHYGLCTRDPFVSGVGIHGSIWLPLPRRSKDLPSVAQMRQVFQAIAGIVPGKVGSSVCAHEPNYLKWRLERARDAAEHAEFLAYSGCRLEEANAARFEDLLPKDSQGQQWVHIRGTKGPNSDRIIPAFEDLVRLFERIRTRREALGLPTSGRLLRINTSRVALASACEYVGVPRLNHHGLRHYFATLALSLGIPPQIVADWMGHRDKGVTLMNTYAHVIREQSAAYAQRLKFSPNGTMLTANPRRDELV